MRRLLASLLLLAAIVQPAGAAPPPRRIAASEHTDQKDQSVYASRRSNVYHRDGCLIRQVHSENLISFTSPTEAQKGGYRACKVCRPSRAEGG